MAHGPKSNIYVWYLRSLGRCPRGPANSQANFPRWDQATLLSKIPRQSAVKRSWKKLEVGKEERKVWGNFSSGWRRAGKVWEILRKHVERLTKERKCGLFVCVFVVVYSFKGRIRQWRFIYQTTLGSKQWLMVNHCECSPVKEAVQYQFANF